MNKIITISGLFYHLTITNQISFGIPKYDEYLFDNYKFSPLDANRYVVMDQSLLAVFMCKYPEYIKNIEQK